MSHSLGIYFAPTHGRQSDRDYIAALQPPVIRLLDPDVQQIADMHALCPHAIIAPRMWTIDDNNGQAVRDLMADPIGTGRRHAEQFSALLGQWREQARQRGLTLPPDDRILFSSANEPNQGGTPDKIAAYSVAFLDRCTELGVRACAPCLGVGWPDNSGPDTPVNWTPYAALEQAIRRNGGFLDVHEYHYDDGPQNNWTWWAGRHLQCPFDVPILLGEISIDNYVDKARWDKEGGNRGWRGNVSPDTYAEMIEWHIRHSDTRVVAALPFLTDYRSNMWESFDTLEAHPHFLARKDRMVPQVAPPTTPTKPIDVHLPSIGNAGAIAFVTAPAGLKLRAEPNTASAELARAPFGEAIRIVGVSDVKGWVKVRYGVQEGYMYSQYISVEEPKPLPTPQPEPVEPTPTGDEWERSIAFTARWEGEYQNVHNDAGNWTGCKVGAGENKGTKWGISACSYPHLDIKNLSREEAHEIFRRDYWIPSGASGLPWPACLLVFDTAILHGVGTAQRWLSDGGPNPYLFAAKRLRVYTKMENWDYWGKSWVNRVSDLLEECAK